jgi:hypothetical protein
MPSGNHAFETNQITLSQAQIDHLSSLHFINKIDRHLRLLSSVKIVAGKENDLVRIMLNLEIFYDNHQTGSLSFDLHNYEYEEIVGLAQNIRGNEFILQEVDNFLSGDVVE